MSIFDLGAAAKLVGQEIFVDTNILIFVDGAHSFDEKQKIYSNLYFELKKNNKLYTSEKCLGEFSNRLTALYYNLDREEDKNIDSFKKYRKSEAFSTSMQCIYDATCQFLNDMEVIKDYRTLDIARAFDDVRSGLIDYCDLVSARICLERDMYFFSDDGDSLYCKGLKIITNNSWMLRNSEKRGELAVL
ncbi:hypothetical protein FHX08_001224 [Rhizobium sp. BK529]|uniref:hypothetical protein n=1 Tax=Rhizobium sp. BK529 TaxID=2586983 RepID=UPI00161A7EA1|nr:hypothetical protein [Rhizobium sp. BK529]MBB3590880.1 hypothetical protein [Rhizobium sp. BK529]